jgi:hypothetical protein
MGGFTGAEEVGESAESESVSSTSEENGPPE